MGMEFYGDDYKGGTDYAPFVGIILTKESLQ